MPSWFWRTVASSSAAGSPGWRERLAAAVSMGADVITTETPRELSRVYSEA
jgi:hypothetical protein